ncbi:MAG: ribonuclease R family protein [Kiritimatiellia bacterium]|jgi:ribonuclease R
MVKRKKKFGGYNKSSGKGTPRETAAESHITGTLSLARSGTGFVAADDGGEDIVIPQESIGQALPGDRVSVSKLPPRRGDGQRMGRIEKILERSQTDIVCTLRRTGRHLAAVPITPNYQNTFNIADPKGAKEGDRIVVRFTAWDNPMLNPDAEVAGVIGPADNPSLDTEAIIRTYDLPTEFPQGALNEAQSVSTKLAHPGPREDLRDKLVVMIDPATARDFDDALSLEQDGEGRRVLGVHIADVSHFVRPGTPLDAEARKRGTSVYLVDKAIPMLPEQLSNGVCSLVPGEDRLALSAFLTFNAAGVVVARRLTRSIIRSKLRLTYEQAQDVIDAAPGADQIGTAEIRERILALNALSQQLRKNRFKRFALDISSPEMQVELDDHGMMVGIHPAVHTVSHELVEEAMIAANEAVAAELAGRRIPYISRFHDAPDPEKIEILSAAVAALGLEPGDLMHTGNLMRLLKAVRGTALQPYVDMQVLRSMKRAEYAVDHEGHFGLAKRFYSHFTSPIRRYPDLVLHRQVAAILADDATAQPSRGELAVIAKNATETEFRAEQASRDLIEIKKYRFLAQQIADGKPLEYDAVVVKVMDFGVFVEVPQLQISGLVHVSALSEKFVRYDGAQDRLVAPGLSVGAGDTLRVLVSSVNFDERKVDFSFVGIPEATTPPPRDLSSQAARRRERRERRGDNAAEAKKPSDKGKKKSDGKAKSTDAQPKPRKPRNKGNGKQQQ